MEKLNLIDILKDCPKGTILYSPLVGEVILTYVSVDDKNYPITTIAKDTKEYFSFTSDGRYYNEEPNSECILFPSKDCRDWSKFNVSTNVLKTGDHVLWRTKDDDEFLGVLYRFTEKGQGVINIFQEDQCYSADVYIKDLTKVEKFDAKWLKPGDAVLVRDYYDSEWYYALFSHVTCDVAGKPYIASCVHWKQCIPYNVDTKYLIGTKESAPEFYHINWE